MFYAKNPFILAEDAVRSEPVSKFRFSVYMVTAVYRRRACGQMKGGFDKVKRCFLFVPQEWRNGRYLLTEHGPVRASVSEPCLTQVIF
jgi:hypothetical protein